MGALMGLFKLLGFGSPLGGMVSVGLGIALALAVAFGTHEHTAATNARQELAVSNYRLEVSNANIGAYAEAARQAAALNTTDYGTLAARCAGDTQTWYQRGEAVGRAESCDGHGQASTGSTGVGVQEHGGGTGSGNGAASPGRTGPVGVPPNGVRDYRASRGTGYVPSHVLPR